MKVAFITLLLVIVVQSMASGADQEQSTPSTSLQGYAEQVSTPTRIQQPTSNMPALQGAINQDAALLQSSAVNPLDFAPPNAIPQQDLSNNKPPISSNTVGGQDEYWVNWNAWRRRLDNAVWVPLRGAWMYGQTRVDYDVTRDRHIKIIRVYTPDPTGYSGILLANRIMQLDGNEVLEFPPGSKQNVYHDMWNSVLGLPINRRISALIIHWPGGIEHVTQQW